MAGERRKLAERRIPGERHRVRGLEVGVGRHRQGGYGGNQWREKFVSLYVGNIHIGEDGKQMASRLNGVARVMDWVVPARLWPRGGFKFGFFRFKDRSSAERVIHHFDGMEVGGRKLRVGWADARRRGGGKSFNGREGREGHGDERGRVHGQRCGIIATKAAGRRDECSFAQVVRNGSGGGVPKKEFRAECVPARTKTGFDICMDDRGEGRSPQIRRCKEGEGVDKVGIMREKTGERANGRRVCDATGNQASTVGMRKVIQVEPVVRNVEWLNKAAIIGVVDFGEIGEIYKNIYTKWEECKEITYAGGSMFILHFEKDEQRDRFLLDRSDKESIAWKVKWDPNVVARKKLAWIHLYGVPFHVWSESNFRRMVDGWGEFVLMDQSTSTMVRMDRARLLVLIDPLVKVPSSVQVTVLGIEFSVMVTYHLSEQVIRISMDEECGTERHGYSGDEENPRISPAGVTGEAGGVGFEGVDSEVRRVNFEVRRERFPKTANDEGITVSYGEGNREMRRTGNDNIMEDWVGPGIGGGGGEGVRFGVDRRPTDESVGLGMGSGNGLKEVSLEDREIYGGDGPSGVGPCAVKDGVNWAPNCNLVGAKSEEIRQAHEEEGAVGLAGYEKNVGLNIAQGIRGGDSKEGEGEGLQKCEGGKGLGETGAGEGLEGGGTTVVKRKRGRPRKNRRGEPSKKGDGDGGAIQENSGVEFVTLQFDSQSVWEAEARKTLEVAEMLGLRSVIPTDEALKRTVEPIREEAGDV